MNREFLKTDENIGSNMDDYNRFLRRKIAEISTKQQEMLR